MKRLLLIFAFIISARSYYSQDWMENVKNPNPTFYELQQAFNEYWKDKGQYQAVSKYRYQLAHLAILQENANSRQNQQRLQGQ